MGEAKQRRSLVGAPDLGPERGWSKVAPCQRGWYEVRHESKDWVAEYKAPLERVITDRKDPSPVVIWHDGAGGFFAPVQIPRKVPAAGGLFTRTVMQRALVRVHGSFHGAAFRWMGDTYRGKGVPYQAVREKPPIVGGRP